MSKLWYLVAIMFGVHEDGKVDVFIFREPKNFPGFFSSNSCQDYVRANVRSILKEISESYEGRPLQQILCVPQKDVERFLKQNAL